MSNFPTPQEAGQVPATEVLANTRWIHKAGGSMTGINEGRLAGRLTGTLRLGGMKRGGEKKAEAGPSWCAPFTRRLHVLMGNAPF